MAFDVKVNIDLTKPVGQAGFGVPLILVEGATSAVDYAEVTSVEEVVTAGFAATTDAYKTARLMFAQNNAPKKLAVCAVTTTAVVALADAELVGKGWRQLVVLNDGEAASTPSAISAVVEELTGKIYFANLETDDATTITVTGLRRTVLFFCDATDDIPAPAAAFAGEIAGRMPGGYTCKNMILTGIAPQNLSDTNIDAIHAKGGVTFVTKAGDNVTSEGKVAGGEYIDIIDSEDYVIQQMTYRTQKLLNNSAKISYDNNGIALLESVAADVLQGAFNMGIIDTNGDGSPAYSVAYALRADTTQADRAARRYLGGKFAFTLSGAVHQVEITGNITV